MQSSRLVGATMELAPLPEADQMTLIDTALAYGNHKSATKNAAELLAMLKKEVTKCWHLPLPINRLHEIPGLVLGPLGLVEQTTIDEEGNNIAKLRVTHDQSFMYNLELIPFVNAWVIEESLSVCVYGFILRQLLHKIIALCIHYQTAAIFISKFDFKSAYRRLHL